MKIEIKERIEKIKNKEIPEGYRKIGDGIYPIDWTKVKMEEIFNRVNNPVLVEKDKLYQEIGIRSHGKGIFHKEYKLGIELGNKRVFWIEPNVFIVNIVFAWEQAIAKTTEKELGMIGSHRFPMYKPVKDILDLEYITYYFKTKRGKEKLELASPGGAGRNKTLGQKEFDRLEIVLPTIREQEKISTILSKWDEGISNQEKLIEAKKKYKKSMMQKIFSQELRFKDENGNDYPEWEEKKLGEIAKFSKGKNITKTDISEEGFECIRYGELYTKYNEVIKEVTSKTNLKETDLIFSEVGDIIIPASGETAIDLATASCVLKNGVALGGDINIIKTKENGIFLSYYMNNSKKYEIASLAQGISVIHIYNSQLGLLKLSLPSLSEQEKIANFLSSIDREIELLEKELSILENEKQSLMSMLLNGIVRTA